MSMEKSARAARMIVVGNEKGGSGKSTIAMHVAVALMKARQTVATVDLPAHGCVCFAVDELFPDHAEVLGPEGTGQLRVRDTEARLYGYSWVDHPTAATFPLDHLIGG